MNSIQHVKHQNKMQKYFSTEVSDSVFSHAKQSLQKKEEVAKVVVKQINPFQEIDDRNSLLEKLRNELAVKNDSHQKVLKKATAAPSPLSK